MVKDAMESVYTERISSPSYMYLTAGHTCNISGICWVWIDKLR